MENNPLKEELKRRRDIFWNGAAQGGAAVGGTFALCMALCYLLREHPGFTLAANILAFLIALGAFYWFGKRFALQIGNQWGPPFLRIFTFLLTLLCFSGIIYGATIYVLYNHVDPTYYKETFQTALSQTGMAETEVKQYLKMLDEGLARPIPLLFNSIFSLYCLGTIPSAIIAGILSFVTKRANR